eukprot:GHRQ01020695.1.p2 GENE.GHRQ01020695.1~~GHRQ01020695.1.p2  ORF type:complete len:147 (-),score=31.27 GHRQ01020695.1:938-1378(-)
MQSHACFLSTCSIACSIACTLRGCSDVKEYLSKIAPARPDCEAEHLKEALLSLCMHMCAMCVAVVKHSSTSASHMRVHLRSCCAEHRKVVLGTKPILLSAFSSGGQRHVFAASDRPTIIYSNNKKLLYSNLNENEVRRTPQQGLQR